MCADALKDSLIELDLEQQRMLLALGVILRRIKDLSSEDFDDLFALVTEYRDAASDEDRRTADAGIMEILEQERVSVMRLTLDGTDTPHPKLNNWIAWVSKKIHDLREEAKLSQTDLAERAGIPQSHISRLENGKHSPSRYTLEKLAKAIGVPVSEFDPTAD